MTIARELVTKLGFSFDRSNLDKFEKAISNFKTKATIGIGLIGFAFKKILDYAHEFSNKVLDTKALAKFSKTTSQELDALQNTFKKFDIPLEKFQNFYEGLTLGIKEASVGFDSEFRKLARESEGRVRVRINGEVASTKQAIDDIFSYLRSIYDESEKIRIVEKVFGVGARTAESIIEISNLTKNEFDQLIEKEKRSVEYLNEAETAAKNFKNEVSALGVTWEKFSSDVSKFAVPFLTASLGGINLLNEKRQQEGLSSALSLADTGIRDFIASFRGEDVLSRVKREAEADEIDFQRRLSEYQNQKILNNSNITNNNKFEFNVPEGTSEQQATFMSETVKSSLNEFWDEKIREVQNNNPEVE